MNDRLLTRYVAGECTPEERRRVERWRDADDAHRERLCELERIWKHGGALGSVRDLEAAWRRLQDRRREEERRADPSRERRARPPARAPERKAPARSASRRPSRGRLSRRRPASPSGRGVVRKRAVWAVVALLVAAAASVYGLQVDRSSFRSEQAVAYDTARTERGERTRLRLADGTAIRLAPESQLRFPVSFGDTVRTVRLRGEAFFEVARDTGRPFVVEAGPGARVRVLGTAFGVRAYPADSSGTDVAVREGRVALAPSGASDPEPLVLQRGQAGHVTAGGRLRTVRASAAAGLLAWTDGRLLFRGAPFAEALRRLERWYDFDARLADPALADRRLTATFAGESLAEVLGVLRLSLGARAERDGRAVTFHDNASSSR